MITGSTTILSDIPSQHLDPMLLVRSQEKGKIGYVMVAYEKEPLREPKSQDLFLATRWYYDLFFYRGQRIFDCARLNQDLRFNLGINATLQTFRDHRGESGVSVSLFEAPEDMIQRFRATFYYEPCLKVQIESLTQEQILTLLRSSRCQNGILESNEFIEKTPGIQLVDIHQSTDLESYQPAFKHGRILLYDIDKNREIIHERFTRPSEDAKAINSVCNDRFPNIHSPTQPLSPSFRMGNCLAPTVNADEFTTFIQQILNSPMSNRQQSPSAETEKHPAETIAREQPFVLRIHPDPLVSASSISDNQQAKIPDDEAAGSVRRIQSPISPRKPIVRRSKKNKRADTLKEVENSIDKSSPDKGKTSSGNAGDPQQSEYIRAFERLFRSFRQRIFECFGDKCEEVIIQAEKKVQFLSPEFDCHSLTESTAHSTLELLEEIVKQARFIKRSKLRQAAITLISDLYNKQYNLLEQHRTIDKVEEIYYRLKK